MPNVDLYTDIGEEEFYNEVLDNNSNTPRYIQNELHNSIEKMYNDGLEDETRDAINHIMDVMDSHGITYIDVDGHTKQQQAMAEIYQYFKNNVPVDYWEHELSNQAIIRSMNSIDYLMNKGFYTNRLTEESLMNSGADTAREVRRLIEENLSTQEIHDIFANNRDEVIDFLTQHASEFTGEYADLFTDPDTASILVDTVIALL